MRTLDLSIGRWKVVGRNIHIVDDQDESFYPLPARPRLQLTVGRTISTIAIGSLTKTSLFVRGQTKDVRRLWKEISP